jgi:hypothetical protein
MPHNELARALFLEIMELSEKQLDFTDTADIEKIADALRQVERETWGKVVALIPHPTQVPQWCTPDWRYAAKKLHEAELRAQQEGTDGQI